MIDIEARACIDHPPFPEPQNAPMKGTPLKPGNRNDLRAWPEFSRPGEVLALQVWLFAHVGKCAEKGLGWSLPSCIPRTRWVVRRSANDANWNAQ